MRSSWQLEIMRASRALTEGRIIRAYNRINEAKKLLENDSIPERYKNEIRKIIDLGKSMMDHGDYIRPIILFDQILIMYLIWISISLGVKK